jgi:hypothetical protein
VIHVSSNRREQLARDARQHVVGAMNTVARKASLDEWSIKNDLRAIRRAI